MIERVIPALAVVPSGFAIVNGMSQEVKEGSDNRKKVMRGREIKDVT